MAIGLKLKEVHPSLVLSEEMLQEAEEMKTLEIVTY